MADPTPAAPAAPTPQAAPAPATPYLTPAELASVVEQAAVAAAAKVKVELPAMEAIVAGVALKIYRDVGAVVKAVLKTGMVGSGLVGFGASVAHFVFGLI